jgi:septum formation protein
LTKYNEKKSISGQSPENIQKSRVKINQEVIVIGADTVVTMDKVIYGKPDNHDQAREMLKGLSGRSHKVITGFAVLCPAGNIEITGTEETKVTFAELSDHEIERYIASGEPMDKAGAYGIQGRASIFVSSIKGCYFNVVGLPIRRIYESIIKIDPGLISF